MMRSPYPWKSNQAPSVDVSNFVVVSGTRTFRDQKKFDRVMDKFLYWLDPVVLLVGSHGHRWEMNGEWVQSGADWFASQYAERHWLVRMIFHAAWDLHGKKAGPIRNREMAERAATKKNSRMVAFWDGSSKGTENAIAEFVRLNGEKRLKVVRYRDS